MTRMSISPALRRMVAYLRRRYADDVINAVLADAEVTAVERGGRQVTVADWDAVMDDQPIDGSGYRIVSSSYVPALVMLTERERA